MKCPVCAGADVVADSRAIEYTDKGESTVIKAVSGDVCAVCGQGSFAPSDASRASAEMLAEVR
jgi:HTH-type transcriptional regulator/antitoxin MqsA